MIFIIYILPIKVKYKHDGIKGYYIKYESIEIEEKWKDFKYKGLYTGYKVSNLGNVLMPDGRKAPLYYDKDGYTRFSLYIPKNNPIFKNEKAIRYPYKTHKAVAELFVKNKDKTKNTIVMHKNDIKDCNVYLNLKWGTPKDNMDDKNDSGRGRYLRGVEKVDTIFSEQDVRDVCNCLYNLNIKDIKDIIEYMGYKNRDEKFLRQYSNLIRNIKRYHCWRFIIDEYLTK